jgi:hypothetical protein
MKRKPQRRDEVPGDWDLNDLLHPAQAFDSPADVVRDPDLTVSEKRAILASWASDACAVEAAPDLRAARPGRVLRFDEIMDALRALDKEISGDKYRRVMRRRRILGKGRRDNDTSAGGAALQ